MCTYQGQVQFKPDGDILKNLEIFQIRNGSAVRVGLYLLAEDELVWNVTEAELFPGISVKPIIVFAQRISTIAVPCQNAHDHDDSCFFLSRFGTFAV